MKNEREFLELVRKEQERRRVRKDQEVYAVYEALDQMNDMEADIREAAKRPNCSFK